MSQLQFYKYATWALLVINIAVLSFFLLTKPHPRGGGPGGRPGGGALEMEAVRLLRLDQEQESTFRQLAAEHSKQLKALGEQERFKLKQYFSPLIEAPDSTNNIALLEQIKSLEGQKVTVTYDHFKALQDLLREDQQVYFERFLKQALQILLVEERR